ncbi:hypothetical protein ACQ4PT_021163 [Festuca glaucescens]
MRLPSLRSLDWTAAGPAGNNPKRQKVTVRKMVMCSDGIVAAIVGDGRLGKVARCRPAVPTALWSLVLHDRWRPLMDIAFYDGKLYAVDEDENLLVMDVGEDGNNGEPVVPCVNLRVTGTPPVLPGNQRQTAMLCLYLVVSDDTMTMVWRVIRDDFGSEFALFKADFGLSRWSEMTSIGDNVVLFVGAGGSGARRLSHFELSRYELRPNRIHFLHDDEFWLRSNGKGRRGCCSTQFGAYDMTDGKIYPLVPPPELHNGGKVPATWLFPRAQVGAPSWSQLTMDVLHQAPCCLPSVHDRLPLGTIWRHWHSTLRLHLPCSLPKLYLALPDGGFFSFQGSLFKPHNNPGCGSNFCSQLLFVNDYGMYSLVNPFTERKMSLPIMSGIRLHEEPVEIINESAPEEGPRNWRERDDTGEMSVRKLVVCPDCLVAAIIGHEHSAKVALYTPGQNEGFAPSWALNAHDRWRWYSDMVFFDGKLYALTNDEDLLALEVGYRENGEPRISSVERVIEGGSRYTLQEYAHMRYLVRSRGGELLMVCRIMLECGLTTYQFLVFRADLQSAQWVEVNALGGDEALFVSRLCSRAVCPDEHGVRGNQIFFLDDSVGMAFRVEGPGLHSRDAFANVYNIKDGRVSELLPKHVRGDGAVPATWLFREDPDAEG